MLVMKKVKRDYAPSEYLNSNDKKKAGRAIPLWSCVWLNISMIQQNIAKI